METMEAIVVPENLKSFVDSLPYSPSKYQIDVWDFTKNGQGNAVVQAVAGSGKTTTIVEALKLIPTNKKVAFFAFNKAIVNELSSRVPRNVMVKTLHGFGLSCLIKSSNNKPPKLNNRKIWSIIKLAKENWEDEEKGSEYCTRVKKLVDLLRVNLIDNTKDLYEEGVKHGLDIFNGECDKAFEIVRQMNQTPWEIDFTDMIYQPVTRKNTYIPFFDYIFVDECQDLNRAQQELIIRAKGKYGRIIAVGDPQQAIYGFAGADIHSFERLQNLPDTVTLPLSVNYRCKVQAEEMVKDICPQFECHNREEGVVNYEGKVEEIQDGDMILCRNTAPLVTLCFKLLKEGRKAYVKGADIGANLIYLVEKSETQNLSELWEFLDFELETIRKKLQMKYLDATSEEIINMPQYHLFEGKIEVLKIIASSGNCEVCKDIVNRIEFIFKDDSEGIVLSTIHKAKGLENNRVSMIHQELLPSRYAKEPWQKQQEENLRYVAYTRWKKEFHFIMDFNYREENKTN